MTGLPTVYVVDDDAATRASARQALTTVSCQVIAYATAADFQADFEPLRPGCVILGLQMPGMNGDRLLDDVRRLTDIPVIVLAAQADVASLLRAMRLGLADILETPIDMELLGRRVHDVLDQDTLLTQVRWQAEEARRRLSTLTPRERELLLLLVDGRSYKEIAVMLSISRRTVEHHREHLNAKLGKERLADLYRLNLLAGGAGSLCKDCPHIPATGQMRLSGCPAFAPAAQAEQPIRFGSVVDTSSPRSSRCCVSSSDS